jgi:hypothetical protein
MPVSPGICNPWISIACLQSTWAHMRGWRRRKTRCSIGKRYREAAQAAGKIGSHVLEWAVCWEVALERVGHALGWSSRPQAYAAALERMKAALDELCQLWGIGGAQ